jgi:hypothetical protein
MVKARSKPPLWPFPGVRLGPSKRKLHALHQERRFEFDPNSRKSAESRLYVSILTAPQSRDCATPKRRNGRTSQQRNLRGLQPSNPTHSWPSLRGRSAVWRGGSKDLVRHLLGNRAHPNAVLRESPRVRCRCTRSETSRRAQRGSEARKQPRSSARGCGRLST